ncbi:alpha/beta hydrolase fold domain-containing protein [Streptococcus hyointestinalis]|uniref:alpha/beta hydrolase fold domain-containing protein n=1 Tax=Streptococcus hyointestinalis TaxID=1337 RepID=UPI003511F373
MSAYARDKGDVNIAFQLPLYPMLDDRMTTDSMKDNDAPIWSEKSNRAAWQLYLGDTFGTDEVSPYAAPARLTDYTKLPPTYTFVGDIEPFYDEVVAYISHLKAAGVIADIDIYKGAFHSFDSTVSKSPEAIDATEKMIEHYRYAASHYFAPQA